MTNILQYFTKSYTDAQSSLDKYVEWAKSNIYVYDKPEDPCNWEAMSWTRWGITNSRCSKLGRQNDILHPDFIDYYKAMIFHRSCTQNIVSDDLPLALRCLEIALIEINNTGNITTASAAIFDRACAIAQEHYKSETTIYCIMYKLKWISDRNHELKIVSKPYIWKPKIKAMRITLKKSEENSLKRLPNEESLRALGEIFSNKPDLKIDTLVTCVVVIMLSQPSRIGEFIYLKKDCFYNEVSSEGLNQLYMLWYSLKGFGANKKPIPDCIAGLCQEAVSRIIEITDEARRYAKWLEDNPDIFPHHANVPNKHIDEKLTLDEACDALMISYKCNSNRMSFRKFLEKTIECESASNLAKKIAGKLLHGYDTENKSVRKFVNGKLSKHVFNDSWDITLRDLNILVREKYLPEHFPYTDRNKLVKWQDALFCFRTGSLSLKTKRGIKKPFGIHGCSSSIIGPCLTKTNKGINTIFERHGYRSLHVNSHAFRHYVNTAAHRGGMSQELIARWSGRNDINQNRVYNHLSIEEKVTELEECIHELPIDNDKLLGLLKTNMPISMKDFGGSDNRIVHRTEFGVCVHDYAQEPCAKFNSCLTCGEHVCVKGDQVKLSNLKEEEDYLQKSLDNFHRESELDTYGVNTWLKSTQEKLQRCSEIIEIMEDTSLIDGALIKCIENGWSAGRNAVYMNNSCLTKVSELDISDIKALGKVKL